MGLFAKKNVFTGFDRRAQMRGTKTGRSRQQNHVHAACDQLLISIEPDELILRIDLDLGGNWCD